MKPKRKSNKVKGTMYTHKMALIDYETMNNEEMAEVRSHMDRYKGKDPRTRRLWFTEAVDVVMCDRRARERKAA